VTFRPSAISVAARSGRSLQSIFDGRLLLAPAILLLVAMTIGPAIYLFGSSLLNYNLLSPDQARFVGPDNYAGLLTNVDFYTRLLTTFLFVFQVVGLELLIGLPLAILLNQPGADVKVSASLLLLPMAITPVVAALVFRSLLNPLYGWVDYFLQAGGLINDPIPWLAQPITAWISVVMLDVWEFTPFVALILLAGLQGQDREILEASAVDGAGRFATFRYITLPSLKPFIVLAVLFRTVDAFKTFGTIQVLTNGGPGTSTEIVNLSIYRVALQDFRVGEGAAMGVVFLILVSLVAQQLLRVLGRNTDLVEG
jgi:multiple sugar transport system permease protein